MKRLFLSLFFTALVGMTPLAAQADRGHGGGWGHHGGGGWGHHDGWRHENRGWGGGWHRGYLDHSWHDGRLGWWWVVGDIWNWYPAAVYPYPAEPVAPVVNYQFVQPVQPAPQVQVMPPSQMWYYCDRPAGYYPYVPDCPSGWRAVPASPRY